MSIVPNTILGKLLYFEYHLPIWAQNPTSIGLSLPLVTEMAARVNAARVAYTAAQAARSTARVTTETQTAAIASMYDLGADMIKLVRAAAEANDDPTIYQIAHIPPPKTASPLGPPETPTKLAASLTTSGNIALKWDGSRVGGTSFLIERSVNTSDGPWTLIGTSEERAFTDAAVPFNIRSLTYRIFAVRSGGISDPTNPFTILLGTVGQNEAGGTHNIALAA